MTDLETIQASWDEAAVRDAMWHIITEPERANGGWTPEDFFAHGRREIAGAMVRLRSLGLGDDYCRALDFGCGIGRLTQALAWYCLTVDGVDVSSEMVSKAEEHNRYAPRVRYCTNGLTLPFPDDRFDLVYSMIVLQHMPQDLQEGYVREFFRVLKPGGVAMFEMPDGPDEGHPGWPLSMYGVARDTAKEWITDAGGSLVDVEDLGEHGAWQCYRYTAVAS